MKVIFIPYIQKFIYRIQIFNFDIFIYHKMFLLHYIILINLYFIPWTL